MTGARMEAGGAGELTTSDVGTLAAVLLKKVRAMEAEGGPLGGARKLWVAVAGAPGSGKTTLCAKLAERLGQEGTRAVVIPMDGYHFYKKQLDEMPDPAAAHARRGAHWTFDAARLVRELRGAWEQGEGVLPAFDHAAGDPVEGGVGLGAGDEVVIVEGNYLLLDGEAPWGELRALFSERWFVACDEPVLRERVITRNSAAWGWDRARTEARVDANDIPNARLVAETAVNADRVVRSVCERERLEQPTTKD